jgi:hypothetical protein
MTQTPKPKPKPKPKSQPNQQNLGSQPSGDDQPEKPYQLISFPQDPSGRLLAPDRAKPSGLDQYKPDQLSGKILLRLNVKTPTMVASGLTALKSDLLDRPQGIPLIKPAIVREKILAIPGSSLKGTVRAIYEAITRSCLCKITKSFKDKQKNRIQVNLPSKNHKECSPNKEDIKTRQAQVCPACQIFGAMNWQGIVRFTDALCEQAGFEVKFVPSLYQPNFEREGYYASFDQKQVGGRKFFYHFERPVEQGEHGIDAQRAAVGYTFTTHLSFMNLKKDQLGALLIALGQDSRHKFALKVGAGKPIGMGSMAIDVLSMELWSRHPSHETEPMNLRDRYSNYALSDFEGLTGEPLQQFMQQAMEGAKTTGLIQLQQLQELAQVLQYPTNRTAPEGMY